MSDLLREKHKEITARLDELKPLVRQPGITIPELAVKMGIKQNYLYRILPGLQQEGKLEKKNRALLSWM